MQLGDQPYDGESYSETSLIAIQRRRRLAEQLEHSIEMTCRNTDARVPHPHHRPLVVALERHTDESARRAEFHSVANQVSEHLLEPHRIGMDEHRMIRQ